MRPKLSEDKRAAPLPRSADAIASLKQQIDESKYVPRSIHQLDSVARLTTRLQRARNKISSPLQIVRVSYEGEEGGRKEVEKGCIVERPNHNPDY